MNFEITEDNKPYLDARGKVILNACPGSGKTSAVSFKLASLTSECEEKFGAYAGIACLSFTNVAKDEIAHKFEQIKGTRLSYPHIVATIDSFVNQYITLPFYHLLKKPTKRPTILNTVSFLDEMNLEYFVNKRRQPLKVSYAPSKIRIEIDGSYSWDGHKPNPAIVDPLVFDRYAKKYKDWQFNNGFLTNDDSTYIALKMLENYPEIPRSLTQRFPYVIVDEAQDTSEMQYKIFDLLIASGLNNIEFVGDPYQSLYEFRKARPDLFIQRYNNTTQWQALRLNHCRRSSQNIINTYSALRGIKEQPIVSVCKHKSDHKLHVIRYDESNLPALIEKYHVIVGNSLLNCILVRGRTHLEKFGVKTKSEEPWKSSLAKTLLNAQNHLAIGNTKACIDDLRVFLAEIKLPSGDHRAKRDEVLNMKEDTSLNIKLFDFVKGMPVIDDTLKNWTTNMSTYIKSVFGIDIDLQLKQKGTKFYSLNLKELLYPQVTTPFPISTIHRVKGMTFNSIMLVLSNNSTGEQISLKDFIPPADFPSEKQRMLYVALSRPETLCCLAVPASFSKEQIVKQLGDNIVFV